MQLIGPHEGREFELLERGEKNVALFYEIIPPQVSDFTARVDFESLEFNQRVDLAGVETAVPYVILYRNGFEDDARELLQLINRDAVGFDPAIERRVGEILGYPQPAIEHYIASLPPDSF
jgi:hypothetical protein